MKKITISLLLISSLCSFRQDDSEPAVKKGSLTAIAAFGYPKMEWLQRNEKVSLGIFSVGAEYQLSRRFNAGLQYSYNYSASGMQLVKNYYCRTFQMERWATWSTFMATADFCYFNRGSASVGAGIGLGVKFSKISAHIIDSVGIDTHPISHLKNITGRIRLIDVKLKIAKNCGVYGGLGMGPDGLVAIGFHYTFTGRNK